MLAITSVFGMNFIPILTRRLKGARRLYMVSQHACISLQFAIVLHENTISVKITAKDLSDYLGKPFPGAVSVSWTGLTSKQIPIARLYLLCIRNFIDYMFYFLTLMQTIDVYILVCFPFNYANFEKKANKAKWLLGGTLICLLLQGDQLFLASYRVYQFLEGNVKMLHHMHSEEVMTPIMNNVFIIHTVKFVVIKITYFTVVTRLAFSTRAGLRESARLSERPDNLPQRIFYFALIPLFISALFMTN